VCRGADQIEKAPGPSKIHLLLGGGGAACMAEKKNEKYDELRDGRHRRQGQNRELYPILPLIREVLHCRTPPTSKRSNQKQRNTQTEGTKKKCSPQKRSADALSTIFSWSSTHRRIADTLSFSPRARPPLNYYPITFIRSLGTKKNRVLQGTVVLHSPLQRKSWAKHGTRGFYLSPAVNH
jgi:hypothetical protein